jgi:fumarate hydratase subunit beta
MAEYRMNAPLTPEDVDTLRAGDKVSLSGFIYTARDAAHKRLVDLIKEGKPLPMPIEGQVIYYVGPSPTPPGRPIGSAGPTTSGRMDPYSPILIERGLRGMIGKGERAAGVVEAMKKHGAVYFVATGGAAALLSKRITAAEIIAYPELGAEAISKLTVVDFPVIVAQDCHGGNIYREGQKQYART